MSGCANQLDGHDTGSHGMNLPVIGRLLGHTQASTTQRYAHVGADPALAAADKIGEVVSDALNGRTNTPEDTDH